MPNNFVQYRKEGHLAFISLNRPERHNALNPWMMRRLHQLWQEYALDREARALVLHGAGPSFCSGMDLKESSPGFGYRSADIPGVDQEEYAAAKALEALPGERRRFRYVPPTELSKPIVAALHGRVSGGGLELALCSDVRIAAEGTTFALPEVTRGLAPGSGGMVLLPRIVGSGRALEWLLTGDVLDCEEAYRIGLVNRIVPKDELLASASAMAERIARNAPKAVQAIKETVIRSLGNTIADGMSFSEQQLQILSQTEDYEEGVLAFKEKREPVFRGS